MEFNSHCTQTILTGLKADLTDESRYNSQEKWGNVKIGKKKGRREMRKDNLGLSGSR